MNPWDVNAFCEQIIDVLFDEDFKSSTRQKVKKEREYMFARLSKIEGIRPYPSSANFLLFFAERDGNIAEALIEEGFFLRECEDFEGLSSSFLRVAVKRRGENREFLKALKKVWARSRSSVVG
jgi:threonine-phosphate decarboxylase